MPRHRRPTGRPALALVVAVVGAAAIALPGTSPASASDGVPPSQSERTHVTESARLRAAQQASRATRTAVVTRVVVPRRLSRLDRGLSRGSLTRVLARIEHQRAVREAARRARRHQAFLDRWVLPIHSFTWSAGFGDSGGHWSTGYHTGQDFAAPTGTPVYAAVRGTITFAGWSDAYGNKLEITDYDGTQTWYAHLTAFERTSGTVRAGALLGYVGCTGNCFGSHLHFEVHQTDGAAIDPVPWLRDHAVPL